MCTKLSKMTRIGYI